MPYRLDRLIPCGSVGDRLIYHYQNLDDPVRTMTEAGYFPKSLEVEEIVPGKRGVHLICRQEYAIVRMVRTLTATIDRISDSIVREGSTEPDD